MLADYLLQELPHNEIPDSGFDGISETLLISIPNIDTKEGLCLLHRGKLYSLHIPSCSGLWLEGEKLYVSLLSPDHMRLRIYEPGKPTVEFLNTSIGDIHDLRIFGGELYAVSTSTNEIVTLSETGTILKRWVFPGIGDSWHINCVDVWNDRMVVSAFGKFPHFRAYKGRVKEAGIVFDMDSQEILQTQLSCPHTPRLDSVGRKMICDSRTGRLLFFDADKDKEVMFEGAFTRGIAFSDKYIFVGLSSLRHRVGIKPGAGTQASAEVGIVDFKTLECLKKVAIPRREIYDVTLLPNN